MMMLLIKWTAVAVGQCRSAAIHGTQCSHMQLQQQQCSYTCNTRRRHCVYVSINEDTWRQMRWLSILSRYSVNRTTFIYKYKHLQRYKRTEAYRTVIPTSVYLEHRRILSWVAASGGKIWTKYCIVLSKRLKWIVIKCLWRAYGSIACITLIVI